jgi:hypothetical protein
MALGRPKGWSLRDLYRTLESPGANRLRGAHAALDSAVRAAYGMTDKEDSLVFLLRLNLEVADKEAEGQTITPPGLPAAAPEPGSFVTEDCIRPFYDTESRPSAQIGSQRSAGKGLAEIHKMRTFPP